MNQARKNARIMQRVVARQIAKASARATKIQSAVAAGKMKSWSEMSWQEVFDILIGRDRWTDTGRWDLA